MARIRQCTSCRAIEIVNPKGNSKWCPSVAELPNAINTKCPACKAKQV